MTQMLLGSMKCLELGQVKKQKQMFLAPARFIFWGHSQFTENFFFSIGICKIFFNQRNSLQDCFCSIHVNQVVIAWIFFQCLLVHIFFVLLFLCKNFFRNCPTPLPPLNIEFSVPLRIICHQCGVLRAQISGISLLGENMSKAREVFPNLVPRACVPLDQRSGNSMALDQPKTGTRKSWFWFDCARVPEIVVKWTSFQQPIRFRGLCGGLSK